jgi:hypothetical protein
MADKLNDIAGSFMSSDEGKKISGKKKELQQLADTSDGQKVKEMLQKVGIEDALESGDTDTVKKTILGVMNTDEGARLFSQLKKMMEK